MKIYNHFILLLMLFACNLSIAQVTKMDMVVTLNEAADELQIQQKITYYNTSDSIFKALYFHNWPNSFKDRKTPLTERFVKDYDKDLYFAKPKDRGFTVIKNITSNFENLTFQEVDYQKDILRVELKNELHPKDSILLNFTYKVKIPNAKFTGYGKTEDGYHLRYWYITPAFFEDGWQLMSNLNLNDLYEQPTDINIEFKLPKQLILESNLYQYESFSANTNHYTIVGKEKTDVIVSINPKKKFKTFITKSLNVYTDDEHKGISDSTCIALLNRQIAFIESFLGTYPYKEIYIDAITKYKNPVYGINQLASFLKPYSDEFNWDINTLNATLTNFLQNTLLFNKRKDYWLIDGIHNYLMIQFVEEYYADAKLIGKLSKIWPLKYYNLAKADYNDKYHLLHRFVSRKFLDQALTTPADSLSNFNRKIANKYKAGLVLKYLKEYIGDATFNESLHDYFYSIKQKLTKSDDFKAIITQKTDKDLSWFFGDLIQSNKKIDYTIKNVKQKGDSLQVVIKNKRNIKVPVLLYTLNNKQILEKQWIANISDIDTVTIADKKDANRISLNYENTYPELITVDNWKSLRNTIFNKPLKFTPIKDIDDPYYHQIFFEPEVNYNFYNGLIIGLKLHNSPIINRNLELRFSPYYATKSNTIVGKFAAVYNQFFEETNIYQIKYGVSGSTSDYAPNLSYQSLASFVNVIFKRKDLRDVTFENVYASLINIHKETAPNIIRTDEDSYSVLNIGYNYVNPDIIKEFRQNYNFEYSKNFSKISADLRFRSLTDRNTQLDFRLYAGAFLHNNSNTDYFSFGLDFSNDYLFQYNYFGRSESSGFFRQQFIIAEGGFKSILPTRYANQYMMAFNSSIGLWRWIEFYNDVAFLKNKNNPVYFAYNNGIRLNFIHQIFELYFPLYSNNGWEISQPNYQQRIRFTITTDVNSIYNFFRRGFL